MPAPVTLITIHHEAGPGPIPTAAQCERFSHGGYACGIGSDTFVRWRSSWDNWATLNFNGDDWTPCFGADRHTEHEISDHDLETLHAAFMDAYGRGEVTGDALVRAHRDSPGSSTACPGDLTMRRWDEVVAACRPGATPPEPKPEDDDVTDLASGINHDGRPVVVQVGGDRRLYYRIRDATGGGWSDWRDLSGGFAEFATVTVYANPKNAALEVWATMRDGKTFSRWQIEPDFAAWSPWEDRTR